jgi:peptidoglycan/LPS O-acetylase OafA/YrhL
MDKNKVELSLSQILSTSRIYALISIVAAHIYFVQGTCYTLFERIGTIGVITFLLVSGYYFKPERFKSVKDLLKKKIVSVCIPWFTIGTITWFYNILLSPRYRSITGFLKWIFGNTTFLYYMPILMVCFLIFYKPQKWFQKLSILATVVSVFLSSAGMMDGVISFLGITNYLNIFNWMGFFGLGMLFQGIDEGKLIVILKKYRFVFIGIYAAMLIILVLFNDIEASYFSFVAIPYELCGAIAIFSVSTFDLSHIKIFARIINLSFAIYLLHMIFIGLFDKVLQKFILTQYLSPIIIIIITFVFLISLEKIANKLKIQKLFYTLTGERKK